MRKISSRFTVFHKKVFPAIWFGFLAVFAIVSLVGMIGNDDPTLLLFLVIPSVMAVFGFFLMKNLVWGLADEVYDCGDSLLVRVRDEEEIALSNVMNVSASTFINPPRVTLKLVTPSRFGTEVAFSPVAGLTFNPFAKNEVIEDLIVRVDRARRAV